MSDGRKSLDRVRGRPERPSLALQTDDSGTIREVTPRGEHLFSHLDESVEGRTISDLEDEDVVSAGTADRFVAAVETIASHTNADQTNADQAETDQQAMSESHQGSNGDTDWFPMAVIRSQSLEPIEYGVILEVTPAGERFEWHVTETGAQDRFDVLLDRIETATAEIASEESVRNVYGTLERWISDLLGPTGIDVRRISRGQDELIQVRKGSGTTPVDDRAVVDARSPPYNAVWPEGQPHDGTDTFDQHFRAVLLLPVGTNGTITIGRVGGTITAVDRTTLEILATCADTAINKIQYRTIHDEQTSELERYETLVESIPDPVYWTDANGRITYVNEAFEDEFGIAREDCRGIRVDKFTAPGESRSLREEISALLDPETDNYSQFELTGQRADGGHFEVEGSIAIVYHDDHYDGVVGVFRDVTERKREEEIADVMNRALRHNLRTSINNIIGYAELAEEGLGDTQENMRIIREEGQWLMKLGDRLRTVRRSIATSSRSKAPVAVDELIDPLVEEYRSQHPNVTFETSYDDGISLQGGAPLQVALDNVINNAVVHNDSEDPRVLITARIDSPDEGWMTIDIADNGPGIPQQDIDLVLGETEITQLQHGTGVGLWVTRWIIDIIGGELDIRIGDGSDRSNADGDVDGDANGDGEREDDALAGTVVSFHLQRPRSGP